MLIEDYFYDEQFSARSLDKYHDTKIQSTMKNVLSWTKYNSLLFNAGYVGVSVSGVYILAVFSIIMFVGDKNNNCNSKIERGIDKLLEKIHSSKEDRSYNQLSSLQVSVWYYSSSRSCDCRM